MLASLTLNTNLDTAERAALEAARHGGRVHIAGYASLMDEGSARATSPSAADFKLRWVKGFCRVFNLISIINIRRGVARGDRLATCTACRREGSALRVFSFSIDESEFAALAERETRLRLELVHTCSGDAFEVDERPVLMWTQSSDEHYWRTRCKGDAAVFAREVGQHYAGRLYRADVLPVPSYVLRCMRAQRAAEPEGALRNFLDTSFLGDGRTTLREWLGAEVALSSGGGCEACSEAAWSEAELEEVRHTLAVFGAGD